MEEKMETIIFCRGNRISVSSRGSDVVRVRCISELSLHLPVGS